MSTSVHLLLLALALIAFSLYYSLLFSPALNAALGCIGTGNYSISMKDNCPNPLSSTYNDDIPREEMNPISFLPNYKNPCWYVKPSCRLKCLPYFVVAGIAKCGSSKLFHTLAKHHQIVPSRVKELMWWVPSNNQAFSTYTKYFSRAAQRIRSSFTKRSNGTRWHSLVTFEGSPNIFCAPWKRDFVAGIMHKMLPDLRIVVTVRHPTHRLYSHYNHFVHKSAEHFHQRVTEAIYKHTTCRKNSSAFACYIEDSQHYSKVPITMGMYDIMLEAWLKVYPRNQIFLSRLEDFAMNSTKQVEKILDFLSLEPMKASFRQALDSSLETEHHYDIGPMLYKTKHHLDQFYKPHMDRLAEIVNDQRFAWKDV